MALLYHDLRDKYFYIFNIYTNNIANTTITYIDDTTATFSISGTITQADVLAGDKSATDVKSVVLGSAVTVIEQATFYGFTNLESIELPDNLTTISKNALAGCTSFEIN